MSNTYIRIGYDPVGGGGSASGVSYDNATSGLTADNVQDAIDEVVVITEDLQNQIDSLPDPMEYKGLWNASTNSPALTDGTGNNGDVYYVSVAGTQFTPSITFNVGDKAVYNGATAKYEKWDMTESVNSVFGRIGNVVAVSGDYTASQVTNVPSGNLAAVEVQAALNELQSDIDTRALDSALQAHINDTVDAHDASAISNIPAGGISATDVQAAINELDTEKFNSADFNSSFDTRLATKSTTDLAEGSNLYFTDERAQDAVGTILVDTASVDLVYTDATPSITATVLPAGVNHNALQNYVANEHVDHSTVSISAGAGLAGGGDITVSRTIAMPAVGTPGTYGSATQTSVITTDTQGRVSAASSTTIAIPSTQITDFVEAAQDAVGNIIVDSADIDFTYSDSTPSITGVLTTTAATPGSFGSATAVSTYTVDSKGRLTSSGQVSIAIPSTQVTDFNEAAQDAVGTIVTDSNTIDFTYNDATPSIVADVKTQMSITSDSSGIKLVNDATSPGNTKYYGTDSGGTRGFFSIPSPGSAGDITETSFSYSNNQSSPADVTGFLFSNATVRGFQAVVTVFDDATANKYEEFEINGIQRGSDWVITIASTGDDSGLAFDITTLGQIQYTSGNSSGFTAGTMKFRAITTSV